MSFEVNVFDATQRPAAEVKSIQLIGNTASSGIDSAYQLEKGKNNRVKIPAGADNARVTARAVTAAAKSKAPAEGPDTDLFNSRRTIVLERDQQYITRFEGDELILERADESPVSIPAQLPTPGQIISIVLLNKTKQQWAQFTMLQFGVTAPAPLVSTPGPGDSPFSADILYVQPFIPFRAFAGSTSTASKEISLTDDWNLTKRVAINAVIGQPVRLIGVFPPNDRKHPLRAVLNLAPLIPTADGVVYEVHLVKHKSQLKIKAANSGSDSDSD